MRSTRIFRAVNWRYAAGELILIVAGILIALAISDWNDRRIERRGEHALLGEIRSSLTDDLRSLESNLAEFERAASQIEELSRLLAAGRPYDPSMDRLFGALYGMLVTNLNTAAYETLKSAGLQSVSNGELRQGIARVYDHYYETLLFGHGVDIAVNIDLMRPYYLRHFKDLKFRQSATPLDPASVIADPYFKNIVDYRLTVLRANQLDGYREASGEIRRVLALLEAELNAGR